MKYFKLTLLLISFLLITEELESRPQYVGFIPYGTKFNCAMCHINPNGGGSRNPFGRDVEENFSQGTPNWAAIFDIDSDGDGYTNGEELQDPNGEWRLGDPPPGDPDKVFLPGNPNSTPAILSVEETVFNNSIQLFPLPSTDDLNIEFESEVTGNFTFEVSNMSGIVEKTENKDINKGYNSFNLNSLIRNLSIGSYFLVMRNEKFMIRRKFILVK